MNDTTKRKLLTSLRRLIESATAAMEDVALGKEQSTASMVGVASMYLAEAVGNVTGSDAARATIHMAAHDALEKTHPERHQYHGEEMAS